jgi:hypothetical protein
MKQSMQVLTSSKHTDWLTPPHITEAARLVMGAIDLDPAAHLVSNTWIGPKNWFLEENDGLVQPWCGRIWLNPPYGKTANLSNQEIWSGKLLGEYEKLNVTQAILLTKTVPGYNWWDNLFHRWPGPLCITKGRIAFIRPEWVTTGHKHFSIGEPPGDNRSKAASSFWYLGHSPDKFSDIFSQFGRIILPKEVT